MLVSSNVRTLCPRGACFGFVGCVGLPLATECSRIRERNVRELAPRDGFATNGCHERMTALLIVGGF